MEFDWSVVYDLDWVPFTRDSGEVHSIDAHGYNHLENYNDVFVAREKVAILVFYWALYSSGREVGVSLLSRITGIGCSTEIFCCLTCSVRRVSQSCISCSPLLFYQRNVLMRSMDRGSIWTLFDARPSLASFAIIFCVGSDSLSQPARLMQMVCPFEG